MLSATSQVSEFRIVKSKLLSRRKITITGCWEYTGKNKSNADYPTMNYNNRKYKIHQLGVLIFAPEKYIDGLQYNHKCNNPKCFNPAEGHVYAGTQAENIRDMKGYGRSRNQYSNYSNHNFCAFGHELTSDNTYTYPNGRKQCRKCRVKYKILQDVSTRC